MFANLTPAQEPVAWYGALGILLNAVMVAVFVFAPRENLNLTVAEQGALAGVANGVYLLIGAFFVRASTTPTAPPPTPAPPTSSQSGQIAMGLLARLVLAVVVGVVVYLLCLLFGPLVADLRVSFAVTIGGWLVAYAAVLGLLAALWFFFSGGGLGLLKRP